MRLIAILFLPVLRPITDTFRILPSPALTDISPDRGAIVEQVRDAALQHNVDPAFVLSIMAAESEYDANALSPSGAIGLMQIMPGTAEQMGYDASKWDENIAAGARYLGYLLERYKGHRNSVQLALAAYNAGPAIVDRYQGVPPFRTTRRYIKQVLERYRDMKRKWQGPAPD